MRIRLRFVALALISWLAAPALAEGSTWAVVVGVDEYVRPSLPRLRYAVSDAKLFARALQEQLKVAPQRIFLMTSDTVEESSQPRAVNIAARLSRLRENVRADDTVIFYFAGHGLSAEGQPFLLTEEADVRSSLTLKVSALDQALLVQALRQLGAGNCWLVLDACRSDSEARGLSPEASREVSRADIGRSRTATMFSCQVGERSWEWDEKRHGCFTYFLVEGLRWGDVDAQNRVTIQSLARYLTRCVPPAARQFGQTQNPWLVYGGPDDWPLATLPKESRPRSLDLHTAHYVAQLETLQARLDEEVARRVAAEQSALLESGRRRELELRLAALAPSDGAIPARALPSPAESPEEQVSRLERENQALRQRMLEVEGNLRRAGQVLERQPEWTLALSAEEAALSRLLVSGLTPAQRLVAQRELRQAYRSKLEVLERVSAAPGPVSQALEAQQQANRMSEARLAAAIAAAEEALARSEESETRANLAAWQAMGRPPGAEIFVIEERIRQYTEELEPRSLEWQRQREKLQDSLRQLHELEFTPTPAAPETPVPLEK